MSIIRYIGGCFFVISTIFTSSASAISTRQLEREPIFSDTCDFVKTGDSISNYGGVSTSNALATKAAIDVLKNGGNAVDAAIAASLVMGVVYPDSTGIGGGFFALYYNSTNKEIISFDARESAPAKTKQDMFVVDGERLDFNTAVIGGRSVATPAFIAGIKLMHSQYGRTEWRNLFKDAVLIASNGFHLPRRVAFSVQKAIEAGKVTDKDTWAMYLKTDGSAKAANTIIHNVELGDALSRLSQKNGEEQFYKGDFAKDIVSATSKYSGFLSLSDIKNYKAKQVQPVCISYRNYKICTAESPSSAIAVLEIMGILENFDLKTLYEKDPNHNNFIYIVSQAMKLGFADRNTHFADKHFVYYNNNDFLNKEYLKKRSQLINPLKDIGIATTGIINPSNSHLAKANEQPWNISTTHISVVDKDGNAVAMTSSIEDFFGSGIITHGFALNNTMTDFSFDYRINGQTVANKPEAHKRPRSSMSPVIILDENNNFVASLGSPGGSRIINYVIKSIIGIVDLGFTPSQTIAMPNFSSLNSLPNVLEIEKCTNHSQNTVNFMKSHDIDVSFDNYLASGINIVQRQNNTYRSASDYRRDGLSIGI